MLVSKFYGFLEDICEQIHGFQCLVHYLCVRNFITRGVRGTVRYSFRPFLALHFVVRFS